MAAAYQEHQHSPMNLEIIKFNILPFDAYKCRSLALTLASSVQTILASHSICINYLREGNYRPLALTLARSVQCMCTYPNFNYPSQSISQSLNIPFICDYIIYICNIYILYK